MHDGVCYLVRHSFPPPFRLECREAALPRVQQCVCFIETSFCSCHPFFFFCLFVCFFCSLLPTVESSILEILTSGVVWTTFGQEVISIQTE